MMPPPSPKHCKLWLSKLALSSVSDWPQRAPAGLSALRLEQPHPSVRESLGPSSTRGSPQRTPSLRGSKPAQFRPPEPGWWAPTARRAATRRVRHVNPRLFAGRDQSQGCQHSQLSSVQCRCPQPQPPAARSKSLRVEDVRERLLGNVSRAEPSVPGCPPYAPLPLVSQNSSRLRSSASWVSGRSLFQGAGSPNNSTSEVFSAPAAALGDDEKQPCARKQREGCLCSCQSRSVP